MYMPTSLYQFSVKFRSADVLVIENVHLKFYVFNGLRDFKCIFVKSLNRKCEFRDVLETRVLLT